MLDWLKTILGDAYTEGIDTKVSEEIGKGFVARKDFNDLNDTKKQLETDIGTKESLIADRDSQIEELRKVDPEKLSEEIQRLQDENAQKDKDHTAALLKIEEDKAIETYFEGYEFTSKAAKKAIMDEFRAAELKFEDGKHFGADDFMKKKLEDDPESFITEEDKKKPKFSTKVDKGGGGKGKMTLSEAMAYKNEHPDANIDDLMD